MRKKPKYDWIPYRFTLTFSRKANSWVIIYPDLPGCKATGKTIQDAIRYGEKAKEIWIDTFLKASKSDYPPEVVYKD